MWAPRWLSLSTGADADLIAPDGTGMVASTRLASTIASSRLCPVLVTFALSNAGVCDADSLGVRRGAGSLEVQPVSKAPDTTSAAHPPAKLLMLLGRADVRCRFRRLDALTRRRYFGPGVE